MAARVRIAFAVAVVVLGSSILSAAESAPTGRKSLGRALAERMCAQCHAVGKAGASPHPAAPAFRNLSRRVDLDRLTGRLREGLTSGHPDMPTFRFTRDDARALVAYLRSIQAK